MKKRNIALFAAGVAAVLATTVTPALAGQPAGQQAAARAVVATFDVAGETFRVKFTDPADIKRAQGVLADEERPHPHGVIVYGDPDVNKGYSWHLEQVEWADVSMEVCDGRPSDVENHAITSEFYCPWGAKLVSLEEVS